MRESQHLTSEACAKRWPRLHRAMRWVAILTPGEAGAALRDYRDGRAAAHGQPPFSPCPLAGDALQAWGHDMLRFGGGEAVAHFGGPSTVIREAVRARRHVPRPAG